MLDSGTISSDNVEAPRRIREEKPEQKDRQHIEEQLIQCGWLAEPYQQCEPQRQALSITITLLHPFYLQVMGGAGLQALHMDTILPICDIRFR